MKTTNETNMQAVNEIKEIRTDARKSKHLQQLRNEEHRKLKVATKPLGFAQYIK